MPKSTSQSKFITTFANLFKGTTQKADDTNVATVTTSEKYIEGDDKSPSSTTRTVEVKIKLSSADLATKQAFADSVSNFWGPDCTSPFDASDNHPFFNNFSGQAEPNPFGKPIGEAIVVD